MILLADQFFVRHVNSRHACGSKLIAAEVLKESAGQTQDIQVSSISHESLLKYSYSHFQLFMDLLCIFLFLI